MIINYIILEKAGFGPAFSINKIFMNAVQKFLLLQAEPNLGNERLI